MVRKAKHNNNYQTVKLLYYNVKMRRLPQNVCVLWENVHLSKCKEVVCKLCEVYKEKDRVEDKI